MNANMNTNTNNHRLAAATVGVLFIIASASAILGLLMYGPILSGSDFLVQGAEHRSQVVLGTVMELTVVFSAIGTAVGLFPFLKKYNESIALGHLLFRFLEAVFISVGVVSVLSLLTLSQGFVPDAPNATALQASGTLLLAVREWTFILGPYLMLGANTVLYSSLLYKSKLVPRPLASLGITGAILVLTAALLQMFRIAPYGSTPPVLMAMPVAVYEMVLAGWLIVKGFNRSALAASRISSTSESTEPTVHLSTASAI